MSYGFEVYDSKGSLMLDDRYFTVVGKEMTIPAGVTNIGKDSTLVGVSILGGQLGALRVQYIQGGAVVTSSKACKVVVYRTIGNSGVSGDYGITVQNSAGSKTFDSNDKFFAVEGSYTLPVGRLDPEPSVPYYPDKEYLVMDTYTAWQRLDGSTNNYVILELEMYRSGSSVKLRYVVVNRILASAGSGFFKETCNLLLLRGY